MTACFSTLFYSQVFHEQLCTLNYKIVHETVKPREWVTMQHKVTLDFNLKLRLLDVYPNICITSNKDA